MSYSQDLWKEFGSSDHDLQNSERETPDRKLHHESRQVEDEFGDFESAESQVTNTSPSVTAFDPWKYALPGRLSIDPGVHQFSSVGPREPLCHSLIDDTHPWMNEPRVNDPPKPRTEQAPQSSLANPHFGTEGRTVGDRVILTTGEWDGWGDFVDDSSPLCLKSTSANMNEITSSKDDFLPSNPLLDSPPTFKAKVSYPPSSKITVSKRTATTSTQKPPPSNVPPPSILLLLIVEAFQYIFLEIKDMITPTGSSKEAQNQLDQESVAKINHRLSTARAAARIVAGRKLRWRRDNYLSQSMKIGPASSGRPGGMKLTGIDKLENRLEDGETEEAVRIWKRHVGSLRAAVATANSRQPDLKLALPEIFETMPVRTAKPSEGALVAPKICFLCGLKRDERIEKVDMKVEDSFGEWWIDHWGHIDCKTFWEEHKGRLNHR